MTDNMDLLIVQEPSASFTQLHSPSSHRLGRSVRIPDEQHERPVGDFFALDTHLGQEPSRAGRAADDSA